MIPLREHPDVLANEAYYADVRRAGQEVRAGAKWWEPERPEHFYLANRLRHLLQLDPNAVYHIVGGSTVAYYTSERAKNVPDGGCCRIVLTPDGAHKRIGPVHIDPRGAAAR